MVLFLDFDGTLAPLVQSPRDAVLSKSMKRVLTALARHPSITVAIVSGRSLKDVQKRVGIPGIIYAGDHGLEWSIDGTYSTRPVPDSYFSLRRLMLHDLQKSLKIIPGVILEPKMFSFSVHYRQVSQRHIQTFQDCFSDVLKQYPSNKYKIQEGKKVYEIRPVEKWTKGDFCAMIERILKKRYPQTVIIAIGDDRTDEDMFAQLPSALTISVGSPHTSTALFSLKNTKAVEQFLTLLSSV